MTAGLIGYLSNTKFSFGFMYKTFLLVTLIVVWNSLTVGVTVRLLTTFPTDIA